MVDTSGDPGLFPVIAAFFAVAILLTLFILPDYICWKRRLRQLPTVKAHQIQFKDEETAKLALKKIKSVKESQQFDKFCEVSRAMTKSKENRAGSDGLLFEGKFSIGEFPDEYSTLERELFAFKTPVDKVLGPIQTHADAYHLAYIIERWDPRADKRREELQKKIQEQLKKEGGGSAKGTSDGAPVTADSNNNNKRNEKKKDK